MSFCRFGMGAMEMTSGRSPSMERIRTRRTWYMGVGVTVGVRVSVGVEVSVGVAVRVAVGVSVGVDVMSGVVVASPGRF